MAGKDKRYCDKCRYAKEPLDDSKSLYWCVFFQKDISHNVFYGEPIICLAYKTKWIDFRNN